MALTHVLQVGETCPGLAQLSVINARVVVGRGRDHCAREISCAREGSCALFPRLQQLYLYLVQYLPALSLGCPAPSVTTGLHLLLSHAPLLTSLQCPGSPLLTDKVQPQQYSQFPLISFCSPSQCVLDILGTGGLCHLTKFVVSAPISVDHRTVPLSQVTRHVAVLDT